MKCYYCNKELTFSIPAGKWHHSQVDNYGVKDHVFPVCLGGDKVPDKINLIWACNFCNEKKNGTHPLLFYKKYSFSKYWSKRKINDFMFRVRFAILYLQSKDGLLVQATTPKWAKELGIN